MSAAGSIKALITKAAKELHRRNRDVWDKFGDTLDACESAGTDLRLSPEQRTAMVNSALNLRDLLTKLDERWERAQEYAAEQSSAEGEPDIMDEFSTHWKEHGYEDIVNEAHRLVERLQSVVLAPTTSVPQN
ncbi:unnamed protein product, partial [Heligmosomoides polygyrus]|uniref:Uncharacterized protein n=1 Tax=Heligmosomoides polygyrus TaxID=6339 RepID=A0A183FCP7_HELPZ